jgi:ferric-dicitrate binding protein FerR (iron transport regulator)
MIQKKDMTHTDRAWSLLYNRLENDGLIPGPAIGKLGQPRRRLFLRWAAAAVLVCCAGAATLILWPGSSEEVAPTLLTIDNEKGGITLVTTLEDGSIVYLDGDSHLSYPAHFAAGKREISLWGKALFDVAGNTNRPFLIKTAAALIEVTGTLFNVEATDAARFELSVSEGEVKVTATADGLSLRARAGETVRLSSSGSLQIDETAEAPPTDLRSGHIRFKDEKLSNILRVVNSRHAGLVLQTTPALENRKITATFADTTPENVAKLICMAFNLSCKEENDILLITEP